MPGLRRIRRDERGSALVLALAFLSVFGVWIASTLAFTESATKVAVNVRTQRGVVYAADGGIEQAIQGMRYTATRGLEGDTSCGTTATFNGQPVFVSCVGQPGSGVVTSGGTSPTLGIITLATGTEAGLQLTSNATVRIDGGVYSHSAITFGGSNSRLNACPPSYPATQAACSPTAGSKGTVTALGACDLTKTIAVTLRCPNGTPDVSGDDPLLTPAQSTFSTTRAVQACPGAKKVITFLPGRYTDAAALTALTNGTCSKALLWFQPGNYYFEFAAGAPTWTVSNKDITVVGGAKTWGATDPSDPSTLAVPGACTGDDVADHPGVEFIFGGVSRLDVTAGRVELCAARAGSAQQVALFGVRTATGNLVAESGCLVATPYTATDASHCAVVRTDNAQSTFVVHGTVYAPVAPVDLGLTNVGYEVISRGIISRVLVLKLTPSAGFTGSLIRSPGLGSVTTADRKVLLTACAVAACGSPGSITKLRVMVTFHDLDPSGATAPGYTATIQSWSAVH